MGQTAVSQRLKQSEHRTETDANSILIIQIVGKCYQGSQGDHKGGDGAKAHALGGQVGDDSGHDGQDTIPECRH